ncbi:DUF2231 domain-containing protein [Brevundimonas sp. Root1423]|uniref:DUF2231 domain-containing protein n=1 Tax=Brevundimonas sp. Root1423 TaxID=1736462 RepID=UPI0006F231ED|nr:DUF2231 domain-containing protein [Brevundimonas sp. Root1423]KQY89814.1 hypothetical protein ASD25_04605 [Brevundimonas sp. Root1423]
MPAGQTTAGGDPHPAHAILLGFPIALFSSALVTDIVYLRTAELQWTNFSAWLISGALLFGGLVLAWALVSLALNLRGSGKGRNLIYVGVLAVMWILGLINALKHSQDGWSSVGGFGLTLSILCTLLALAAGVIAHSNYWPREVAR